MHAVILGNGVAGIEAALALRTRSKDAKITVVSEESPHFFSRTALMYVLAGQLRMRDIEPYPRDLDRQARIERVQARAVGLDAAGHRLLLADGRPPLAYDKLLIACGSRPRPSPWPGSELRGIGHFVTLQDLAWLEEELHGRATVPSPTAAPDLASPYRRREPARPHRASPDRPRAPLVIGGGLIGIEVVETLLSLGLRPRFLMRDRWFWPIALDARESAWVADALRRHGVEVETQREVERFVDDGRGNVGAVVVGGEERPCDLAVVAVGVVPNVEWLASSGARIAPRGGLEVDDGLQTSLPDVLAAGDCAAVPMTVLEAGVREHRPEQLWYTARDQGRVAGARMAGEPATYARGTPYNSAKLMDIEYTTVGLVPDGRTAPPGLRDVFHEETGPVRSTTRLVLDGDRLVGFNALGRRWDHAVIARWIEQGRTLAEVRASLAREAAFDTELVPPLVLP